MTAEELKLLLSTPAALFLLMLAASFGSAWKQMMVARRSGTGVTVLSYFIDNWPETLAMIGHNIAAFIGLIFTDTLNPGSAIGFGYLANDTADAWTKDGRSVSMGGSPRQGGFIRIRFALLLAAIACAMTFLSGCATTPVNVIQIACTPGTTYTAERCAKGIGETYEVYQKRTAELVSDPLAPADVKESVKAAEAVTSDVVVRMLRAGAFYAEVKQQLAAGQTTEEQLAIADANLEEWVRKALPLIRSLGDEIGGR